MSEKELEKLEKTLISIEEGFEPLLGKYKRLKARSERVAKIFEDVLTGKRNLSEALEFWEVPRSTFYRNYYSILKTVEKLVKSREQRYKKEIEERDEKIKLLTQEIKKLEEMLDNAINIAKDLYLRYAWEDEEDDDLAAIVRVMYDFIRHVSHLIFRLRLRVEY